MTTPTVDVRPATRPDAALLARLNHSVHAVHVAGRPDVFRAASSQDELVALFEDFLRRENALAFIARSSGEAVGYATATLHERSGDVLTRPRSFVALEHLAVDPGAARAGIGTALVDAVRTAGKEAGCASLVTDVWGFNDRALAFFAALGLTPMRHWLERPL